MLSNLLPETRYLGTYLLIAFFAEGSKYPASGLLAFLGIGSLFLGLLVLVAEVAECIR